MQWIGFTGTRTLDVDDAMLVWDVVQSLPHDAILVVGACVGVDATVARAGFFTDRRVHAIVPGNLSQVDPEWDLYSDTFELMPEDTDYRQRNERIVKRAERMIVIAQFAEDHPESKRSGTWMTKRISQKMDKPTEIHLLRS